MKDTANMMLSLHESLICETQIMSHEPFDAMASGQIRAFCRFVSAPFR